MSRFLLIGLLALGGGCTKKASSATKSASGTPKQKSSKPSGSTPTPSKPASSTATSNQSSSADAGTCDASQDGMGDCLGDYVVFCSGGQLWALDCTTFESDNGEQATCGTIDGEVTCGWDDNG